MRKKLLLSGVLLLGLFANAQILTFIGNDAIVTVQSNTLVYNGGGLKLDARGVVNNSGNIMLVGSANDKFETDPAITSKFTLVAATGSGANILTDYGQLYIDGFSQTNLNNALVYKQARIANTGAYQQMALPFSGKTFGSLTGELGKTFTNVRRSQNEILTYDKNFVVLRNTDIASATSVPAAYYVVGAKKDAGTIDFTAVHTLVGKPYASVVTENLSGAQSNANFGDGGNGRNIYNEKFNSYLQDSFDTATPWEGNFGKNIYQYANPYLTNLDLSGIYKTSDGDGNTITNIQGIRISPGTYVFSPSTGGYTTNAIHVTFNNSLPPVGDVNKLFIRPLETFVIKLRQDPTVRTPPTAVLNFSGLRRFTAAARDATSGYGDPTTKSISNGNTHTIKQLGVIALNESGEEMGRAYFIVYNEGVSGHSLKDNTQVTNSSENVIGTFEEDPNIGGFDNNFTSLYWLYINEVNEQDFKGKPVPLALYNSGIKNLKFEIRENADLIPTGQIALTTGIGFNYKDSDGVIKEISQDQVIPVNSDYYSLFYGKPEAVLATGDITNKPSRTTVVYNPSIDNYIVRFDPSWKKAEIQVFDLSGKLVLSKKSISTDTDFTVQLPKEKRAYIVTAVSEKGDKASAKIIR